MNVESSYAYCRQVARREARNFYYSFLLLDKPQRDAMCAIYAFMRHCDDLSDGPEAASAEAVDQWRQQLSAALTGQFGEHPCWPAFHHAVQRFAIPAEYFYDMIEGIRSDLEPRDIATFDELYRYCYQVASVVGLTIIHIFGFRSKDALPLAEKCGIAFQLTNILRDVKEDAELGRYYLPKEDRERFPEFRALMQFEAARARRYYEESAGLLDLVAPRSRPSLWAMIEIYRTLLARIERSGFAVMERRIRVPAWQKVAILVRAYVSK